MRALVLLLTLSACDPYPRDHYAKAALGLPSCWAPGVVFAVPPELCPTFLWTWRAATEKFGRRPAGTWKVTATAPPEGFYNGGDFVKVWGRARCETGRMEIAEHPNGWCSSALAHEFIHALECPDPDRTHVTWSDEGKWDGMTEVMQRCDAEAP